MLTPEQIKEVAIDLLMRVSAALGQLAAQEQTKGIDLGALNQFPIVSEVGSVPVKAIPLTEIQVNDMMTLGLAAMITVAERDEVLAINYRVEAQNCLSYIQSKLPEMTAAINAARG